MSVCCLEVFQRRSTRIQSYRVNERIKSRMIRLVLADGTNVGIVTREQAF